MKRAVVVIAAAIAAMVAVAAPASARTPILSHQQAVKNARLAVKQEYRERTSRPRCRARGRYRAVCRVRWHDGLRAFRGTVTVSRSRSGESVSPVDTYRIKATGTGEFVSRKRVNTRGRLIVETRKAHIGEALRLFGYDFDPTDIEVTPHGAVDPFVSSNEFSVPDDGTRFVAYPVTVRNIGSERFDGGLYGFDMILTSGVKLDLASAVGCDADVDMAPGETREACIVFEVPIGVGIQQLQFAPGQETGIWRP